MSTREITVYITCRTVSMLRAFLDTGLPRGNGHERDSGPMQVPFLPNPTTRKGWPHHRGLRPLIFSNSDVGSFTSHMNQISASAVRRDYGFSSLSEKTRKSFADVITKTALSSQLFKDPEC